ncbi:MAG: PKD domain-containing protein [Bacteroidota bacterium]
MKCWALVRCSLNALWQSAQAEVAVLLNWGTRTSGVVAHPRAGVCVEEGVYQFALTLPISPESYHISYQRCCRNNTITNIVFPGDVGATYTMDLTPTAQFVCNNSPVFNEVPPIVICANEPIDFDFSATDPDGDDLVYSFCTPFTGGGTNQTQPTLPNGVAPNPDLPPPYQGVPFAAPYSATDPMQGNPTVTIDPNTGFITGVPEFLGQYVVGVCVEEYRNGQLLSVVRRDFQFNVADCEPTVVADVQEDVEIANQEFQIISCGEETVDFVNESFQQAFIDEFFWEFDINGNTIIIDDVWSPSVTFPGIGIYTGQLVLNPGTVCGDTANLIVSVFPEINADFEFAYELDSCTLGSVLFTDLSFTAAGINALQIWEWDFGDGNTSGEQDPNHQFSIPGNIPVELTVEDVNGCRDSITQFVEHFPVPEELEVNASEFIGCEPAGILFDRLPAPIDSTYDVQWEFGDGNVGEGVNPFHVFENEGIYTVSISVTSPIGCFIDTVFDDLITVLPSPTAGFSFSPENPNSLEPRVTFTDESIEASFWRWELGDFGISLEPSPTFVFPDTGLQQVLQIVTHESGCRDTAAVILDIFPEVRYFLPNAFTPNGDGTNDGFRGEGVMEGAVNFRFQIWNRYGELVFESGDPFEAWNGTKRNSGEPAPAGVYVVVVRYTTPRGQEVELNGFATLIR